MAAPRGRARPARGRARRRADATVAQTARLLAEISAAVRGGAPVAAARRAAWDRELTALATRFENLAGDLAHLAAELTADDLAT